MNNKADKAAKVNTQLNYDVDVFLSIQQAAINNRVLIHAVDSNGKVKQHDISNDILKIQKGRWFNSK